jgi:hypothetical protein
LMKTLVPTKVCHFLWIVVQSIWRKQMIVSLSFSSLFLKIRERKRRRYLWVELLTWWNCFSLKIIVHQRLIPHKMHIFPLKVFTTKNQRNLNRLCNLFPLCLCVVFWNRFWIQLFVFIGNLTFGEILKFIQRSTNHFQNGYFFIASTIPPKKQWSSEVRGH